MNELKFKKINLKNMLPHRRENDFVSNVIYSAMIKNISIQSSKEEQYINKSNHQNIKAKISIVGTPKGARKGGVLIILKDKLDLSDAPHSTYNRIVGDVSQLDIGDILTINDLQYSKKIKSNENRNKIIALCRAPKSRTNKKY